MSTEVSARNEAEVKALVYTGPNGLGEILLAETNEARRATAARAGAFRCYAPDGPGEPADSTFDLIIDAVGTTATRARACRMAKAGGILVHIGLLPRAEGFD